MPMMLSYRVRADRLDEHRRLLTGVFAELATRRPANLRYESHVLDDGRSFVDWVDGPDLPSPLDTLSAFQRFRAELEQRCDIPITMSEVDIVDIYRDTWAPIVSRPITETSAAGCWFTDPEINYLDDQLLGRLATVDRHGAPQNNPVGFFIDRYEQKLLVGGLEMGASRKFRNIRANPYVAFVVDDVTATDPWTPRGLEIRGVARALVDQDPPAPGYSCDTIEITPTWIASWGMEPGTSFNAQIRTA